MDQTSTTTDQSTIDLRSNIAPESPSSAGFLDVIPEKLEPSQRPISPPPSSRPTSRESLCTTSKRDESPETPLRPGRRLPATPSTPASEDKPRHSLLDAAEIVREKSPVSLSSLSDYDGSETSHTERRFLRLYEELESHCSLSFPDFITPWFLRRLNYGPCKAGDIVDLLRFLRPKGLWTTPFGAMTALDPYLSASLEKAVYPNVDSFSPGQITLLQTLHYFIFSAYNYAQGIFFPFDREWDEDRRDAIVDALNLYVEDTVALIEYIHQHGRDASLRDFVSERTETLRRMDQKRVFFFAEGGDTRNETEEYVFNMFLAILGLWTVGTQMSDVAEVPFSSSSAAKPRFDYTRSLPYRPAVMGNISFIRETFGVLMKPVDGVGGMEWVQPLQDFDASNIIQGPFHFSLSRDISRHMTLDGRKRSISLFCEDALEKGDSLSRLDGNIIAATLNLDSLDREHKLIHALLFSSDESRQIAFSLGLVPPRKARVFLRLSAFPNYAPHLLSLRSGMREWQPRRFKEFFLKGSQLRNVWYTYAIIAILIILLLILFLAIIGTIGVWIIFKHIT